MKFCIYGGQFGSEGKGSYAAYLAKTAFAERAFAAVGEAAPNSGHTCPLGKVRNVPAASFYATTILLGPDSIINPELLVADLAEIYNATRRRPQVLIHECAAISRNSDIAAEVSSGLEKRIASTNSGSWIPRRDKYIYRTEEAVFKHIGLPNCLKATDQVSLLESRAWLQTVHSGISMIFECSQGLMLDTNFGYYPYCTSRSTLPLAALTRNGIQPWDWQLIGVFRTFPIRTGGNSGPTGGRELTWDEVGVVKEQATVTKRIRRVFEFSRSDFELSMRLAQPNVVAFTHADYLKSSFQTWYEDQDLAGIVGQRTVQYSSVCGDFARYGA